MSKAHFGMIGLGTMGRNFLLNAAEHGITGVGTDLIAEKRELLLKEGAGLPVQAANDLDDFFAKLEKPRNILMLVPAGPIVDSVIGDVTPHLEPEDLLIDGGNSHFNDTERREAELAAKKIGFMGIGISGGEEGARHGASIMPGGRRAFYDRIEKTLQAVAAKVSGEPCVAYMGPGGAGHFVKMVHNGIEYGMMQLIAETYDYMKRVLAMDAVAIADTFVEWNSGELNSFLIEITAIVLRKIDPETGKPLVEMILDTAGQKGTGRWTSQTAMDLGVAVPTIDAAVSMRQISAQKTTRKSLAAKFRGSPPYEGGVAAASVDGVVLSSANCSDSGDTQPKNHSVPTKNVGPPLLRKEGSLGRDDLQNALHAGFIIAYAQGMSLLAAASSEKSYDLNLADIAKIWRGGCIIRSAMLGDIRAAYDRNPTLESLMLDDHIAGIMNERGDALRKAVASFVTAGIPGMCFASALNYFDGFRTTRLPANLIQAQRDLFGSHTYQRVDKEGTFHTADWEVGRTVVD